MKPFTSSLAIGVLVSAGALAGCSGASTKSPAVVAGIRESLDQFGYKDVTVVQDRVEGVVTLTGRVSADADKEQAEWIARSIATGQIVSDEIEIAHASGEKGARTANSDVDKGIAKNVDAALIQNRVKNNVSYRVKSGVVTLNGRVRSRLRSAQVEEIASSVPNVKQVVNKLEVEDQGDSSLN
jgi:osmotically-inducible protein OsmY